MGGEITAAIKGGLRKSAKEVLEHTDDVKKTAKNADEAKQIDEVIEHLYQYFDVISSSKIIYKETRGLEKIYLEGGRLFEFEKKVKYLDKFERKKFEIFVQHDRIIDKNGKLFDTNGSIEIGLEGENIVSNKSIYVMSETGEIYISKSNEIGKFHHSSFLSGSKIAAAGDIIIENGIIKQITNHSGHYRPIFENVKKNMLKELSERGYFSTGNNIVENLIFKQAF